ncbi:MAG TPA: phosphatidylinositol-specific phospholipase C/glycerophosphodiester phosphodiesterase family protein [Cyclobacteriaceae bacterium]|nr:phosphatidylinositol-specific phospholipase C/glycerophosphodiester phosphodiesterase family protein [Cyclobacteriaceae bacterium]
MKSLLVLLLVSHSVLAQVHPNAHAHNDYEHTRPLFDALSNGFGSVEADVYLVHGTLLVSHNTPGPKAKTLEQLYLRPLDSLIQANGGNVYANFEGPFWLMIDCKTSTRTYEAIREAIRKYPALMSKGDKGPVRIFLSGNRPLELMVKDGYSGLGIDGRPEDVGKGYDSTLMPVISDHYSNWCSWKGKTPATENDLQKIRVLAARVHQEGKKLRLWAIPDREEAWKALMEAGVDLINTDHLKELNAYLLRMRK